MKYGIGVFVLGLFVSSTAMAGNIADMPKVFASGDPARASEVNDNFNALRVEVDGNADDVTANGAAISANAGIISGHTTDIGVNAGNIGGNTTAIGGKVNKSGDTMTGTLTVPAVNYSTAKTRHLFISHLQFQAFQHTNTYSHNDNYLNPLDAGPFYFAQINLPQGAVISRIDVYTQDDSATQRVSWYVRRYTHASTNNLTLGTATGSLAGTPGAEVLSDVSIINATVNNSLYWYYIRTYFDGGFTGVYLKGAKITYTITSPD